MTSDVQKQLKNAFKCFENKEFRECLEILQEMPSGDIYSLTNRSIVLDHLGSDTELMRELFQVTEWLKNNKCRDYRVWWAAAFLNHKVQKFEEAIFCIDGMMTLDVSESLKIEALIRKGYCLEALRRFNEAIQLFHQILNDSSYTSIAKLKPEIFHGLGHFYNERGNFRKSISDIKRAEQYMQDAANLNTIYYTCYGTMYSENKNYQKALEIFNEALGMQEIQNDKHVRNELLFYKAEALSWVGDYARAYELFDDFEKYCEEENNKDGKVHCIIYKIETTLREMSIFEIELDKIRSWLEVLRRNEPSSYANRSIHEEWKKLNYLLEGLYDLKKFLEGEVGIDDVMKDIISSFKNAMNLVKIEILVICDMPDTFQSQEKLKEFLADEFSFTILSEKSQEGDINLLEENDVMLVALYSHLSPRFVMWLSEKMRNGTIIMWYDRSKIQIPPEMEEKVHTCSDLNNAVKIVSLLSAYDRMRKDLIEPIFLFGLAPTTQAPSYSSQTGCINELILAE